MAESWKQQNRPTGPIEAFISTRIVRPLFKPSVIYLCFAALFLINVVLFFFAEGFYRAYFYGEDKAVEWITFCGFFFGSLLGFAVLLFYHRYMNNWTLIYLAGFSLFLFVCAGEEISWGQRVFGFATPEAVMERNEQNEFNIHNMDLGPIHPRDIIGLFNYLWGIILPVAFYLKSRDADSAWRRYVFSPLVVPCFVWAEFLNAVLEPIRRQFEPGIEAATLRLIRTQSEELVEMFWGLSALVGAMSIYAAWMRYHRQNG